MTDFAIEKKKAKRRDQLKIDIFCYALLIVPIINWLVLWVCVNINALILPFHDEETGVFTLKYFTVILESFKAGGPLLVAFKNTIFIAKFCLYV